MSGTLKDKRYTGVVSPRFSSAANNPNPDGSMGPPNVLPLGEFSSGVSNETSPVPGTSVSPAGSHTKSIMNVSGTSGAVVSNTPEPGLKRVATVTFSDPKSLKQANPSETELDQGQTRKVSTEGDKPGVTANERHRPAISSPLMGSVRLEGQVSSVANESRHNPAPVAASEQQLLMRDLMSKEKRPSEADSHAPKGAVATIPLPGESSAIPPKVEEHPHFFVGDPLHTPGTRSRSNSTSPRSSIAYYPVTGIALDKESATAPNLIDSAAASALEVIEESASQKIAPNIPKRENAKNTDPRLPQDDGRLHILFGATGSLAVFKIKLMIKKLEEIYGRDRVSIQVILTQSAERFFTKRFSKKNKVLSEASQRLAAEAALDGRSQQANSLHPSTPVLQQLPQGRSQSQERQQQQQQQQQQQRVYSGPPPGTPPQCSLAATQAELPAHIQVWVDRDEWDAWDQRTDPVLHIELRRWADILVVAPLTANTLSKIALGLCDNLLTSVVRAWNPMFPIFLAPSMVSSIYNSTVTKKQLKTIKEEMPWITVFKPSEKVMGINGDIGLGGMMDGNEIVDKVVMKLGGYPKDKSDEEEEEDDDEDEDDVDTRAEKTKDEDDDEDDDDEDDDDEDEDEDDDEDEDVSGAVQNVPGRVATA